ncbi:hypothetical protein DFH06DRAFT_1143501 [Mycena polygramma]|nr:hypothetical protein DFH06DRAFT_1143501 [Mycena polygramma]
MLMINMLPLALIPPPSPRLFVSPSISLPQIASLHLPSLRLDSATPSAHRRRPSSSYLCSAVFAVLPSIAPSSRHRGLVGSRTNSVAHQFDSDPTAQPPKSIPAFQLPQAGPLQFNPRDARVHHGPPKLSRLRRAASRSGSTPTNPVSPHRTKSWWLPPLYRSPATLLTADRFMPGLDFARTKSWWLPPLYRSPATHGGSASTRVKAPRALLGPIVTPP